MREVILYIATSLDSFIARKDGSVDWLDAPEFSLPGEDFGYKRFIAGIDAALMGYRTFRETRKHSKSWPYNVKHSYVFTRSRRRRPNPDVVFVHRNIPGFVKGLKGKKGKNIWLIGGAQINTLLLNRNLIDRIIQTIIPTVIGSGIPMFTEKTDLKKFRLVKHRVYSNGFAQITWKKR